MKTNVTKEYKEILKNPRVEVFYDDSTGYLTIENENEIIATIYDNGNYNELVKTILKQGE